MSDRDLATLQQISTALKAARQSGSTPNNQVVAMMSYLAGLLDAYGIVASDAVEPGFARVFGEDATPDPNDAIDDLIAALDAATAATRDINWRHVAGAVLEGAAMVIVALAVL